MALGVSLICECHCAWWHLVGTKPSAEQGPWLLAPKIWAPAGPEGVWKQGPHRQPRAASLGGGVSFPPAPSLFLPAPRGLHFPILLLLISSAEQETSTLIYVHLIFIYFKVIWVICSRKSCVFGTREGLGWVQPPPGPVTWVWDMLQGWDLVPSPPNNSTALARGDLMSMTCRAAPPPGHPPLPN